MAAVQDLVHLQVAVAAAVANLVHLQPQAGAAVAPTAAAAGFGHWYHCSG